MKIEIAKSAGFCFGVRRAIDIALNTPRQKKYPVYMLKNLVHNENVVKKITDSGIKKLKDLNRIKNGVLLLSAHGASRKILDKARNLRLKIIDATCPMVKEIHKIVADMDKKGYKLITIGDSRHDEVQGIIGQIRHKAIILEDISDIKKKIPFKLEKAAVVVQSTQDLEKIRKMQISLKNYAKDLRFFNTICIPTRLKQTEIKKLARRNSCVIIIGSKTSANTKRLYQIAKAENKNSHWINSHLEIQPGWFKNTKSVGISAGASTPDETINAVKERIQEITSHQ